MRILVGRIVQIDRHVLVMLLNLHFFYQVVDALGVLDLDVHLV